MGKKRIHDGKTFKEILNEFEKCELPLALFFDMYGLMPYLVQNLNYYVQGAPVSYDESHDVLTKLNQLPRDNAILEEQLRNNPFDAEKKNFDEKYEDAVHILKRIEAFENEWENTPEEEQTNELFNSLLKKHSLDLVTYFDYHHVYQMYYGDKLEILGKLEEYKGKISSLKANRRELEQTEEQFIRRSESLTEWIVDRFFDHVEISKEDAYQLGREALYQSVKEISLPRKYAYDSTYTYYERTISKIVPRVIKFIKEHYNEISNQSWDEYINTHMQEFLEKTRISYIHEDFEEHMNLDSAVNYEELPMSSISEQPPIEFDTFEEALEEGEDLFGLDGMTPQRLTNFMDNYLESDYHNPEEEAMLQTLRDAMRLIMDEVLHDEVSRKVIEERYGFKDGCIHPISEIAKKYNLTPALVRGIEERTLKTMRHPKYTRQIREFRDDYKTSIKR